MNATATTFRTVAAEMSAAFVTATRTNGETFYKFKKDAPAWIADNSAELMRGVHEAVDGRDCRLPDDFIYRLAALAAEFVSQFDDADDARGSVCDFADGVVETSIPRLFAWAADHANNRALADEFFSESFDAGARMASGFESGVVAALQGGQYLAAERVAAAIIDAVENEAASR